MNNFSKKIVVVLGALLLMTTACSKKKNSSTETPTDSSVSFAGSMKMSGSNSTSTYPISPLNAGRAEKKYGKVNKYAGSNLLFIAATLPDHDKTCSGGFTESTESDGSKSYAFNLTCDGFKFVPFEVYILNTKTYKVYNLELAVKYSDGTTKSETTFDKGASAYGDIKLTLDTDTGQLKGTATATIASTTSALVNLDSTLVDTLNGNWVLNVRPYAEVSSKYSANDWIGINMISCYNTYWHSCASGVPCNPETAAAQCAAANSTASAEAYNGMMQERMGGGNMPLYFSTSQSGSDYYLNVWPSTAHKAACGNVESGYTFKFSDGTKNVNLDLSSTGCTGADTNQCLVNKIATTMGTVIGTWFPFLNENLNRPDPTVQVSCKYLYDIWGDFWNPNPEMMTACQADNNCNSLSGDLMNSTRTYVFQKLFAGITSGSADAIIGKGYYSSSVANPDYDFSDNVTSATYTLKWGYRTWDQAGEHWVELSNPSRTDLGGCLQWPDWSKCQNGGCSTQPEPVIVPVGEDVKNWGYDPNSSDDDSSWKCGFSEKRMLVQDENGYITLNGVKYRDAQSFITVGGANFETWTKICDVGVVTTGTTHDYQTYPIDYAQADIERDAKYRVNGGSPEQKKGIILQAIYESLVHDGGPGGEERPLELDRWFWTGMNSNVNVTCGSIVQGTANWTDVQKAFDNVWGPWDLSLLLKCAMVGVYENGGTGEPYVTQATSIQATAGTAVWAGFESTQAVTAGTAYGPKIFNTLKTNSCIPEFQMTQVCSTDGFCAPKVLCDNYEAADGGCTDGAQPSMKMAEMKVGALPNNKLRFVNIEDRFDIRFNPMTNSNVVCQRAEYMEIQTDDPVTVGMASVGMTFKSTSAEVNVTDSTQDCNGKTLDASDKIEYPEPPMFTTFTRQ